jgi:hypothetical protein
MISRLFLVGLVGVLGISIPDGAGWGKGLPRAPTVAAARAECRAAVIFEPIAVVESPINGIADELNRRSEGLDLPTVPIVSVAKRSREAFVPAPPADSVELKLMAEICQFAEVAEAREIPVDRAIDDLFADNGVWGEPATEQVASNLPPARVDSTIDQLFAENRVWGEPATDRAVDELFAENRVWGEPAMEEVAPSIPLARESRPTFESIAAADTASGIADELNRAPEGQSIAPATERSVGTALRLTRSAALAWMNVLTNATSSPITSR